MYDSLNYKCVGSVVLIPCEIIDPNPYSYRTDIDSSNIDGLAVSVKNIGIIQPLLVRRINKRYQIISGERRLRAAIKAELSSVPCIVMNISDIILGVYSLTDNIQRKNLHFFDESHFIDYIIRNLNVNSEQLSLLTGKSVDYLSSKIKINSLCDDIKKLIIDNHFSEEYAGALVKIKDYCVQIKALEYFINNKISVDEIESYITTLLSPAMLSAKSKIIKLKDINIFINTINHAVDTMQKAGIDAIIELNDSEEYTEYVIRIPKITTSPVSISEYIGTA